MADDPFSALKQSLKRLFIVKAHRKDTFTDRAVQELDEAIKYYDPQDKESFIALQEALKGVMPQLRKAKIPFDPIHKAMDALAVQDKQEAIQWDNLFDNMPPESRYRVLHQPPRAQDLLSWLGNKSGAAGANLDEKALSQAMLELHKKQGFSEKLSAHLEKNPDFLFAPIMKSVAAFKKISKTRLILRLTDEQIAKAIIKHCSALLHEKHEEQDPFTQVTFLVKNIDRILSHGRSISTLLRNTKAKSILEQSEYFRIYQSEAFKNQLNDSHPNTSPTLG